MDGQRVVEKGSPAISSDPGSRRLDRWQLRLLPFINKTLLALMVFFFMISLVQMGYLHWRMARTPQIDLHLPLSMLAEPAQSTSEAKLKAANAASQILLEANAMDRRYHQAAVILMARVWTSYLGFVTGMMLVFVGAIFVLARVQVTPTTLEAQVTNVRFGLQTAAPGIVLASLGVALMLVSLFVKYDLTVLDRAIFTGATHDVGRQVAPSPPPITFPSSAPPVSPSR